MSNTKEPCDCTSCKTFFGTCVRNKYIKWDVWKDLIGANSISRGKPNIPRKDLDPWGNPVDTRGF